MRWDVKECNVKVDITKDILSTLFLWEKSTIRSCEVLKKQQFIKKSNYIVPIFTGISWMNLKH